MQCFETRLTALMPNTSFLPALEFSHLLSQHELFMKIGEVEDRAGKCFLFQLLYHFLFFVPLFSPVSYCLMGEGEERKIMSVMECV